jgi:hypothetical protein
MSFLTCPRAKPLYRRESVRQPGLFLTATVLKDTIKGIFFTSYCGILKVGTFRIVTRLISVYDQLRFFGGMQVILAVFPLQSMLQDKTSREIKITLALASLRNLLNMPVRNTSLKFLGVFAKLRKATTSFVMCLSVLPSEWNNSAPTGRIFIELYIWVIFENMPRKYNCH